MKTFFLIIPEKKRQKNTLLHVSIQKGVSFLTFIRCAFHMRTDQIPEKTHPVKAVWV